MILPSRLSTVAAVAERLPVGFIPEQRPVSSVRSDVIHIGGLDVTPLFQAVHAQWMQKQVPFSGLPPRCAVSLLCGRAPFLRMKQLVFVTVLRPGGNQRRTAGMPAGNLWFRGHWWCPPSFDALRFLCCIALLCITFSQISDLAPCFFLTFEYTEYAVRPTR